MVIHSTDYNLFDSLTTG